jgi:hypothetical protein
VALGVLWIVIALKAEQSRLMVGFGEPLVVVQKIPVLELLPYPSQRPQSLWAFLQ